MKSQEKKSVYYLYYLLILIATVCFIIPIIFEIETTIKIILGVVWVSSILYIILRPLFSKKSYESYETKKENEYISDKKNTLLPIICIATGIMIFIFAILFGDKIENNNFISMGSFFIGFGMISYLKRNEKNIMDERTKKMAVYGIVYSWYTTGIMISAIIWTEYTINLSSVLNFDPTITYMVLILSTMGLSAILFQQYLYRKPDLNVW